METWKTIKTHSNYEISNIGNVRRKDNLNIKRPSLTNNGYMKVTLYPNCKTFVVHRLVAEYFIPKRDGCHLINHKNGVKTDNRVENLEWVTASENTKHWWSTLSAIDYSGINNPASNLTEQDIIEIRNSDDLFVDLAVMYGVTVGTIRNIRTGKTYKNLPGPITTTLVEHRYKGGQVGVPKITPEVAYDIKYKYLDRSNSFVAKHFSISVDIVVRIRQNKTWKHI